MRLTGICTLALAVCLLTAGCSAQDSRTVTDNAVSSHDTASEVLVSMDDQDSGVLDGVTIVPSQGFGVSPNSPAERAGEKYTGRVDIGVSDTLRGVETQLIIPMYYGDDTVYTEPESEPESLSAAVAKGSAEWVTFPAAHIEYHLSDGVLVLDTFTFVGSESESDN